MTLSFRVVKEGDLSLSNAGGRLNVICAMKFLPDYFANRLLGWDEGLVGGDGFS